MKGCLAETNPTQFDAGSALTKQRESVSRKNNLNVDHYNTRSSGRQGDGIACEEFKKAFIEFQPESRAFRANEVRLAKRRAVALTNRVSKFRRQSFKRIRKVKGLSARQLMERKRNKQLSAEPVAQSAHQVVAFAANDGI